MPLFAAAAAIDAAAAAMMPLTLLLRFRRYA